MVYGMGRRGKCLFTLAEKKRIVDEAYEAPDLIRPTVSKFGVPPYQIRSWKKVIDNIGNGPILRNRFIHRPSSSRIEHHELYEKLLEFFESERALDRPVGVGTLVQEAVRLRPDLLPGRLPALRQRIERFLRRENLSIRRKTYEAQRTRQSDQEENDFIDAVNQQIVMLKLPACCDGQHRQMSIWTSRLPQHRAGGASAPSASRQQAALIDATYCWVLLLMDASYHRLSFSKGHETVGFVEK
jgi:hypothetical protein